MVAKHYTAESEFSLYGQLLQDLADVNYSSKLCKLFCFEHVDSTHWHQVKFFETPIPEECGKLFTKHKASFFLAAMDYERQEFCFHGEHLCILAKYNGERIVPIDFEDRNPPPKVIEFEKSELKHSVAFLKKILSED